MLANDHGRAVGQHACARARPPRIRSDAAGEWVSHRPDLQLPLGGGAGDGHVCPHRGGGHRSAVDPNRRGGCRDFRSSSAPERTKQGHAPDSSRSVAGVAAGSGGAGVRGAGDPAGRAHRRCERGSGPSPAAAAPVELRRWLLDRSTSPEARDGVWRELVGHSRRPPPEGPAWTVAAVGLALPGLTAAAGRLTRGWRGDTSDLDAELLAGFVARLRTLDASEPRVLGRLLDAAIRAGRRARAQAGDLEVIRVERAWSRAPAQPSGSPRLGIGAGRSGRRGRPDRGALDRGDPVGGQLLGRHRRPAGAGRSVGPRLAVPRRGEAG